MSKRAKRPLVEQVTPETWKKVGSWLADRLGELAIDEGFIQEDQGPEFLPALRALASHLQEGRLALDGLRPDQVCRLLKIREGMLGWRFLGCAVDIDDDYYWARGDRVRGLEEAELFKDAAAAEKAIKTRIRSGPDDERELTVVGVYRKGDALDRGPSCPDAIPVQEPHPAPATQRVTSRRRAARSSSKTSP